MRTLLVFLFSQSLVVALFAPKTGDLANPGPTWSIAILTMAGLILIGASAISLRKGKKKWLVGAISITSLLVLLIGTHYPYAVVAAHGVVVICLSIAVGVAIERINNED